MPMTPLQWAEHLHRQAVRNLRRLESEQRRIRYSSLDQSVIWAREKVAKTLENLRAAEATQQAELGSAPNLTSTEPDLKGNEHAARL